MPMLCEPVVCLTLPAAAAAYAELGWPALSLLAGPAANIADMLRTLPLPYHAPALPFSHTVILFCCFGRQARVCISLVRECIRGAQGGLACLSKPHTSFCQPVVLETYSHGYYPTQTAPTLHSRLLRLLIDGMQLAF